MSFCRLIVDLIASIVRIYAKYFLMKNFGLDDTLACIACISPMILKSHVDIVTDSLTISVSSSDLTICS